MMFNNPTRWSHSSREKLTSVSMSASWFLMSTDLIRISGSKLTLSNNQSSATLWFLDTCLNRRTSQFDDHFDHCFVVLKNVQLALHWEECAFVVTWSKCDNWSTSRFPFFCVFGFVIPRTVSCCWIGWYVGTVRWTQHFYHHIINQEQIILPFAIQHPTKWFPIL